MTHVQAMSAVVVAIEDARARHRSFASWHEAYAVIKEELEEFWDSVKVDRPDDEELFQVAACAILAVVELSGTSGELPLA